MQGLKSLSQRGEGGQSGACWESYCLTLGLGVCAGV